MQTTDFRAVFLLWGAGLGAAGQYAKLSVAFPYLPERFPEAGGALGLAVSLVGALGILLGVVAGVLVSRAGFRRTVLAALWIGAALSALQALPMAFSVFLGLRLLEGVSHLALVVALPTLIAQISSEQHRGFTLTLWGTFFGVAFALMALVGLPLIAWFGVSGLFVAHGIYLALFALILPPVLRPLPRNAPEALPSLAEFGAKHVAIYRSPFLCAPAIGWLFYTFCFVAVLTVMPVFIPKDARIWTLAAMPLASILSSMTLGVWLLRFMPATSVTITGFIASIAMLLWLAAAPGLPAACIALMLAMGLIQGSGFASVAQLNKTAARQAEANGAMAQMGNLGNTLGTPVLALAISGFGFSAIPALIGAMLAFGALAHLALAAARRGKSSE